MNPPEPENVELLRELHRKVIEKEKANCAPYAMLSTESRGTYRATPVSDTENRTLYAKDRDKLIHSNAFIKLSGKTQVFISPKNPLISNRMTHTLQVAQIAKTIARAIGANEDLAEAIALGHDLGHPPFGHRGEVCLSQLCKEYGIGEFHHNVHSLRTVDLLEKGGEGLNLSWEVREGILCHDGEVPSGEIQPMEPRKERVEEYTREDYKQPPSTLEGCIVKLSDRIAYVGRDIEDAITGEIIKREELPKELTAVLGSTNAEIIDTIVKDIIVNFERFRREFVAKHGREPTRYEVVLRMTPRIRDAMNELIGGVRDGKPYGFNYPNIYLSEENLRYAEQADRIIRGIFVSFMNELSNLKRVQATLLDYDAPASEKELHTLLVRHLMRFTLGELENFRAGILAKFSEDFVDKVIHEPKEREMVREKISRLSIEKVKQTIISAIDGVRLTILRQNIEEFRRRANTLGYEGSGSILSFLKGMNEQYLVGTTIPEKVRDYVASLTDDMAIAIFEKLYIPKPIV
ncbi:MAG: dNTP triphosphohydrolase [Thermoplasmata archaeon]